MPSGISASPSPRAIRRSSACSAAARPTTDLLSMIFRKTGLHFSGSCSFEPGRLKHALMEKFNESAAPCARPAVISVECQMKSTEDAAALALIAAPDANAPDETGRLLDAMAITELASMWGALQRLSRRDQTSGSWAAVMYFDGLPHDDPGRALDLALEVLRSESDKPTLMQ